jgi:hypothetical protein
MIQRIIDRVRQHWPEIMIFVRGDAGVAGPEMYDYCESQGLLYAFGYGMNPALKHRVSELELEDNARLLWWMSGRKAFQMFHMFDDYQVRSWSRARRIVTKVEITQLGSTNVRFVVTNMSGLVTPRSSPAFSSSWMRAPAGSDCFTSLALSFAECVAPESTSLSFSLCLRYAAVKGHTGREQHTQGP